MSFSNHAVRTQSAFGLLALALLLSTSTAAGQGLRGGLNMGMTVTTFTGESDADFDMKARLAGGVSMSYDFGNGFLFQPEVLYLSKGASATTTLGELEGFDPAPGNEDTVVNASWDLAYIDVPLLAVYRFETRSRLHPKLLVGPSLGLNLDANVSYSLEDSSQEYNETDESIQNIDYGLIVGAAVEVETGLQRFDVGVRALLGRANVREVDPPLHNTGVIVFLGLLY